MDIHEAVHARHAVRKFLPHKIEGGTLTLLNEEIERCRKESGLNINLALQSPQAFGNFTDHYGFFSGVQNYIALGGADSPDLEEKVGYWGEQIVLKAQMIGLSTCWVGQSYSRRKTKISLAPGEKLVCVIPIGYGATRGVPHKSRPMAKLCRCDGQMPDWFRRGMEYVMLAPSGLNQQNVLFVLGGGNRVFAQGTGGFFAQVDLGIAKFHFELGAGKDNFVWG
ncbi:MAG: nitroreductase family protein [Oscillospiraceae bacterium]|nr:nitroreductase family protein [Oscillospiraceae bacterium]